MEMNLKKQRAIVSKKTPIYKKIFPFMHICHKFGEPNASLSPSFQQFGQMFREKVDLTGQVTVEK